MFGNHDADSVPYLYRAAAGTGVECLGWCGVIEAAGKRIAVTHGHMSSDVRHLLGEGPDYLLSGHTHIAAFTTAGTVRRINPGALKRADMFTVALLEVESGALRFLDVPG